MQQAQTLNRENANDRQPVKTDAGAEPAKRSVRPFLILGAVVLVGLAVLGFHLMATADQENTDDAQIEGDVVALAPRIGGFIKEVPVVDNQHVNKGDVVLKLDDADLVVRLSQAHSELAIAQAQQRTAEAQEQIVAAGAKGGLHSAKAMVSSSQVNVHGAEAQVQVARAALERAQADASKAALDFARTQKLRAGNAVSAEALDSDRLNSDSATAALAQAQARLEAAQSDRSAASSRVAQAQGTLSASEPIEALIASAHAQTELANARVQAAQASIDLAQMQLSYATVTAPEAGVISKLSARPGGLVSASQPFAQLVPSYTYVVANFKETQVGRMRPGDPADIEVDAYSHRTFHGKVESLSGGTGARFSLLPPDNASGNFVKVVQRVPVRIAWERLPDVPLRVGLSVDVTVKVGGGS